MKRSPFKRWLEDKFLDLVLWCFALAELPHLDEASPDCPCARCLKKRRKRRNK